MRSIPGCVNPWVVAFGVAVLGCSGNEPKLEQPVGMTHVPTPPPPKKAEIAMVVAPEAEQQDSSGLYYQLCDLPDQPPTAPHFPPDSVALRPRGKQILDQVANCMVSGELKGESVIVIGYADPRGSDEYNLELALGRAAAVRAYLIRHGVPPNRVTIASRGEHYSRGTGPETWQLDRRVEIQLDSGEKVSSL